ncbi:MAG: Lon protease family protein [Dehalococcoidia bacterium]
MTDLRTTRRVEIERLTARCDPADLPFHSTQDIHPLDAVFGQERAVRAIEFALGLDALGYNLYASGPEGIGKATIVEAFLRQRALSLPTPPDWVYVYNFQDNDRPVGISLPPGEGRAFAEATDRAVHLAADELQRVFDSDTYARQRQEIGRELDARRTTLLDDLRGQAERKGFALSMTPSGITSAPLINGKPLTDEEYEALPQEQKDGIQEGARQLEEIVGDAMLSMRSLERAAQDQLQRLDAEVATGAVAAHLSDLVQRWGENPEVRRFLIDVSSDLVHEQERLRAQAAPMMPGAPSPQQAREAILARYEVNVFVSRDPNAGAPVVVERHPTYYNLIGRIEYFGQFGTMTTNHRMIKPGSLALASGGFMILRVRDVLQNPNAYDGLKRALAAGAIAIETLPETLGLVATSGLRPEAMPLKTKVALTGDAALFSALYRLDPDFRELFRVKADFEPDFPRDRENMLGLASVTRAQCDSGGMRCVSASGMARLIEHSSRLAEDQRRLSANIGAFTDLVRQSEFWAAQDGSAMIEAKHVERALEELEYRSSLLRDRIQMMIDNGTLFIDTAGEAVGQINALSVYDLGDTVFGRPSRITCVTAAGRGTIVNVEREADMAGRIHNKGFMILRGFLADRFGQENALSLHASLTFEQLYGDIDGDSASSTEVYAILSALSGVPISQSIAVTGSVNQRGEIQPIGGATHKIEGFYEVCRARGLDGTQGVMIPAANVPNVVLRPEVAAAIEQGQFHVWSVETIEQGIEILTGVAAGTRDGDGRYPEGTVFRRVEDRLDAYYHALERHRDAGLIEQPRFTAPEAPEPQPPGTPPEPPPPPPIQV